MDHAPNQRPLLRPLTPSAEIVDAAKRVASGELAAAVAAGVILHSGSLSSGSAAGARIAPAAGFTPARFRARRVERMTAPHIGPGRGTPERFRARWGHRLVAGLAVARENVKAAAAGISPELLATTVVLMAAAALMPLPVACVAHMTRVPMTNVNPPAVDAGGGCVTT